jgi:hypothetical protein
MKINNSLKLIELTTLFLLINTLSLKAQEYNFVDTLLLMDSTLITGQVLSYQPRMRVIFRTATGDTIVHQAKEVDNLSYRGSWIDVSNYPKQVVIKKGFYGHAGIGQTIAPQIGFLFVGIFVDAGLGYRFNKWLGVGVAGALSADFEYSLVNIRGTVRVDFKSPMYAEVGVGAGRVLDLNGILSPYVLDEAKWGLHLRSCMGWRIPSKNSSYCFVDVGFELWDLDFRRENTDDFPNVSFEDIKTTYFRPSIRFGFMF